MKIRVWSLKGTGEKGVKYVEKLFDEIRYLKPVCMHGRIVFLCEIREDDNKDNKLTCCDCNSKGRYIVFEQGGEAWVWCGYCNIGG